MRLQLQLDVPQTTYIHNTYIHIFIHKLKVQWVKRGHVFTSYAILCYTTSSQVSLVQHIKSWWGDKLINQFHSLFEARMCKQMSQQLHTGGAVAGGLVELKATVLTLRRMGISISPQCISRGKTHQNTGLLFQTCSFCPLVDNEVEQS